MAKLHYCINGTSVTEQVMIFRSTRLSDDYLLIQLYYDNYKDQWYKQVAEYIDRQSFDSEFDFKLIRAVDTFNVDKSNALIKQYGWSQAGRFNRWFFRILSNWKSNIKSSAFRLKKRPPIQCPICCRLVGKIDQEHLLHYKSLRDLPKFVTWKSNIYEVYTFPRIHAICWGKSTPGKMRKLKGPDKNIFKKDRHRVDWPWWRGSTKCVVCPFTKKIIPKIDDLYIRSLDNKYNRYADPIIWEDFIERYPRAILYSEIYSLDKTYQDDDGESYLSDYVSTNYRLFSSIPFVTYEMIQNKQTGHEYEHLFYLIEDLIDDEVDQGILKLLAAGHSMDDIESNLQMERSDIRKRMKCIRENHTLLEDAIKHSM